MKEENLSNMREILKRVNSKYKRYKSNLNLLISFWGLDKREMELYKILLRRGLRIKELAKRLNLSERTIRRHVKTMLNRGFIKRKVIQGKRLAYEYLSLSPLEVWKNVKAQIKRNISFIDKSFGLESKEGKDLGKNFD